MVGFFRLGLTLPALLLSCASYVCGGHVKTPENAVSFNITLTWEDHEPAGMLRKMILANGEFPAPELRLMQGDDVEFLVVNDLPFATTVHFHGIEQANTPWSDGVPGLSQRPIPSGDSFLYKWRATNHGSYFYHAHHRGQQEDGLYGAIHILADPSVERPFGLISQDPHELRALEEAERKSTSVILSDVRQITSEEVWDVEEVSGLEAVCTNAFLVNGKGSVICLGQETINQNTSPPAKEILGNQSYTDIGCLPPDNKLAQGDYFHDLSVVPPMVFSGCTPSDGLTERLYANAAETWVSFDLISAALISSFMFAIDEHPVYVYATDGDYIEPQRVDALAITNGVRYSVMVKLDKPAGDYTIRLANLGINQIINGAAVLTYHNGGRPQENPSVQTINLVGTPTSPNYTVLDESTVVPYHPQDVSQVEVAQTHILKLDRFNASYLWTLGNTSFPLQLEDAKPLLFYPRSGRANMTIASRNGTWVDLVFDVATGLQPPHPIHKHSNKFYVLGQGMGEWNHSSVAEAARHMPESFNFKAPMFRDTFATPPAAGTAAWLAVRYHVVNPGAFFLHCHIQVHQSGGMALALLDGIDEWPEIPEEYQLIEDEFEPSARL